MDMGILLSLTLTDYITASLLALFFVSGWMRGFVRSVIGPLAFLTSTFASMLYFGIHRDISDSIFFILAGTILLALLGYLLLYSVRQTVSEDDRDYVFWGSRLLGALLTVFWKGSLMAAALVLLTALSPSVFGLKETQEDIRQSLAYHALDAHIISNVQVVRDVREFLSCLEDPQRTEAVQASEEFKILMQDQKMQDLLADPQVVEAINSKDVARLVLNRQVIQLFNDKDFVEKFLAFAKVMYQSRSITPAPAQ